MVENAPVLIPIIYLTACLIVALTRLRHRRYAHPVALAATLLASLVSLGMMYHVVRFESLYYHFGGWLPPVGIEYVVDPLSAFVVLVINAVSFFVLISSLNVNKLELGNKVVPYYSVVMLLMLGLNGIVLTGDFFNLFVFLEISSLASYALIAVGERGSAFAAFRYLILGTVGASLYLLGLGFLYMITGSLNMGDLALIIAHLDIRSDSALIIALVLMVTGVGIKMAIFPLHGWLPDAYTFAPSATSALIAPIGTKVASYVLIRMLFFVYGVDLVSKDIPLTTLLGLLAAVGIVAGSILAVAQTNIKRLLAWSSVANIGYIVLGIALVNQLAYTGALLHILNHAIMKAVLFIAAGAILYKMGTLDIRKLRGLPKKMPLTTTALIIAVLSMVGIPPTGGFFSKIYLILGAMEGNMWFYVAVILFGTLLSFVYFFRAIEIAFFKPYRENYAPTEDDDSCENLVRDEAPLSMLVPMLILSAAIILVGIFNGGIVDSIVRIAMPVGF